MREALSWFVGCIYGSTAPSCAIYGIEWPISSITIKMNVEVQVDTINITVITFMLSDSHQSLFFSPQRSSSGAHFSCCSLEKLLRELEPSLSPPLKQILPGPQTLQK